MVPTIQGRSLRCRRVPGDLRRGGRQGLGAVPLRPVRAARGRGAAGADLIGGTTGLYRQSI